METKTWFILGFLQALVIIAIGLIASSAKRLDSTEGEVLQHFKHSSKLVSDRIFLGWHSKLARACVRACMS